MRFVRAIQCLLLALALMCMPAQATNGKKHHRKEHQRKRHGMRDDDGCPPRLTPRKIKVLIVSMFPPEAEVWYEPLQLTQRLAIPGLPELFPELRCNDDDVCQATIGMGFANSAASMVALTFSPLIDMTETYVLIGGVAGINPKEGTVGSAAWARWLVTWSVQHEIDAREKPQDWSTGYWGIFTEEPGIKPAFDYDVEAFLLDEALVAKALELSKGVALQDSDTAAALRAKYVDPTAALSYAAARTTPQILQCDTMAGDTWFTGELLATAAEKWFKLLSDGDGTYCTTQQEDNATYNGLKRGANAGRFDIKRILSLRTGINFDRQPPGLTAYESINSTVLNPPGGVSPAGEIAFNNIAVAGLPIVNDIVENWSSWQHGVPE